MGLSTIKEPTTTQERLPEIDPMIPEDLQATLLQLTANSPRATQICLPKGKATIRKTVRDHGLTRLKGGVMTIMLAKDIFLF